MSQKEKTILVVDDQASIRKLIEFQLNRAGYNVKQADGGNSAIEVFDEEIDLVLLDYTMPDISGIETMTGIRNINPKAKIMLLTGHGRCEKTEEAFTLGALDCMSKPFREEELISKLRDALA